MNLRMKMGFAQTEMFTDRPNRISLFAKVFRQTAKKASLQHLFKIAGVYVVFL